MTFRYHAALRVAPAIALDLAATCWAKPPPSVIWLAAVVSQKVSSLSPCPPAACSQWRGQSNPVLKHEPFHVRPQLWTRHGSPHILSLQAQITKKTKQKGNALERPNIAIFFLFPKSPYFVSFESTLRFTALKQAGVGSSFPQSPWGPLSWRCLLFEGKLADRVQVVHNMKQLLFLPVCTCAKNEMSLPEHECSRLASGKRKKMQNRWFHKAGCRLALGSSGSSHPAESQQEVKCLTPDVSH